MHTCIKVIKSNLNGREKKRRKEKRFAIVQMYIVHAIREKINEKSTTYTRARTIRHSRF